MCRHACPVGHVTHRETYTPHAWALTIESVKRGQLRWNEETASVLYACADCGLCRSHCVTDQPLPEAIVAARMEIASAGVAPPVVGEIERRLRAHANAYVPEAPAASRQTAPTALFVGDVAHIRRPADVESALRLLGTTGIHALPICRGRSSGLLASTLGLRDVATSLATAVVDNVRATGATEVLVLSAADRWTFEHVYPVRLGVSWPASVRVIEVTEALRARSPMDGCSSRA
jgi:Fe-S oxidoreductase